MSGGRFSPLLCGFDGNSAAGSAVIARRSEELRE